MSRLPALFIGHGSPMIALERNDTTRTWRRIADAIGKPRAILAISAHWLTRMTAVTAMARPRTIHDFGAFPQALFDVQYPAPGSPELADEVRALLDPLPVGMDTGQWGLDHGTWSVLVHAYPDADVPVIQLGMDATKTPAEHHAVGRALRPLRDEGVLILGSGQSYHNMRGFFGGGAMDEQAEAFDAWLRAAIIDGTTRDEALIHWEDAPYARVAQPHEDHLLPLMVAAGAASGEPGAVHFHGHALGKPISGFRFG